MRYKRLTVERWKFDSSLILLTAVFIGAVCNRVKTAYSYELLSPLPDNPPIIIEVPGKPIVRIALELVDYIHLKESTRGKNNTPGSLADLCIKQGKSNEYGYGGMDLKICFDSKKEARAWVLLWVEDHLKEYGGNSHRVLCHYNLGTASDNCSYASGF